MRTMYYSDITNKSYDTQAECVAAEMKFKLDNAKMRREFERIKKQAEEATKKDNRTELRNNLIEAIAKRKEVNNAFNEAFRAYSDIDQADAMDILLKELVNSLNDAFNEEEDEDDD